jgi:hypothetical protein
MVRADGIYLLGAYHSLRCLSFFSTGEKKANIMKEDIYSFSFKKNGGFTQGRSIYIASSNATYAT